MKKSCEMFIRLNTVLVPEDKVQNSLVELAKRAGKNKACLFHTDNRKNFPHITLYAPEYPKNNFTKVINKLEDISKKTKEVVLEFDNFVAKYGYLIISFKESKAINNLHKLVLQKLNHLREGRIREKYEKEIKNGKYTKDEVNNIQNYSYHHVLETYNPHLTLARFENNELAQKAASKLEKELISCKITFPFLAISEMGPHGTCTKILKRFKLAT